MLNYHSNAVPPSPQYQQSVAAFQAQQSPYGGQNLQDNFRALQQANAVDMSRYAQQKSDELAGAASDAQRESALAGLTLMSQAQNNAQDVANRRMQLLLQGLL